ncbi:hypothetical protein [Geobacter pickeringii]|uniref:Lipoprotein n=1 Tax=Geobacter pickeringii TaxID=345632 RepID=A0A0B5B7B7_9BACT|nr:hypothetical protein [Geobacter pickeringii]AJE02447.1 hypothetical protein GPICK_02785 [Geobacter pickeringii]
MWIRRVLVLVFVAVALAGCRNPYLISERFTESSREYNRSIRWRELEQACLAFADRGVKDECLARAAAKGVSVADYRVVSTELDPEKGTATVHMEIDYYVLPSTRLKSVRDVQQWRYEEKDGDLRWRIVTPPPEFK